MKRYIISSMGDAEYSLIVVIPANNRIAGYNDLYYHPDYKMYLNTNTVIINSITGTVTGKTKLHDTLISEIVGNNPILAVNCAQATFKNGRMQDDAVNLEILSELQLEYINSLF